MDQLEVIGGAVGVALAGVGQLFVLAWGIGMLCFGCWYFLNRNKTCEPDTEPDWEGSDE